MEEKKTLNDSVSEDLGEESRSIVVTAALLHRAVQLRRRAERQVARIEPTDGALFPTQTPAGERTTISLA